MTTEDKSLTRRTLDSFVNFAAKLGYRGGSQQDNSHYQFDFISRNRIQMEAAYRSNWIAGVAVDTVAEDMTRAGVEITSEMDPEDITGMGHALKRLEIWEAIENTIRWSRLYGGAIAVMLIDGQRTETPLRLDSIKEGQFKGLLVLDRWMVQPTMTELVQDYGPSMGLPKYYDVVEDSMALARQRIHHTRCIRLDGLHLPYRQRIAENLWGQSVLERIWDRMIAFDSTTEGAAQLVYKAHLRTYKVENLRDIISTGGPAEQGLLKQIEMTRQTQSNEGLTLMDTRDEFETNSYSFTGLSDMMLQFGQQLSGALQVPMVRLFGQSPAGLNSSGESDLRTYYDNINSQQESRLRRGLHVVFEVMSRSELGKPLPDNFDFAFRPLWQMDDVDKASVAQTVGSTLDQLEQSGNISHANVLKELRDLSKSTGFFSSITDEQIAEAEAEPPEPETNQNESELPEPPDLTDPDQQQQQGTQQTDPSEQPPEDNPENEPTQ